MLWPLLAALAADRVETTTIDGVPIVLLIDESAASYGVVRGSVHATQRDWSGATVLSAGMRRWWTLDLLRQQIPARLLALDAVGWVTAARKACPPNTPAHAWLATAASLGGASLDHVEGSENASQAAARFRQARSAQPFGVYGIDSVQHLAALHAWLARPVDDEVRAGVEAALNPNLRQQLEQMRSEQRLMFGRGDRDAVVPRGLTDPLLQLIQRPLAPVAPRAIQREGQVRVQPQLHREPCDPCSTLGPAQGVEWRGEQAFRKPPMLLIPGAWSARNRPVMVGFIGVQVRHGSIRYERAPSIRRADGQPLNAQLAPQEFEVYEPRPVRIETVRPLRQSELPERFANTLEPTEALSDLTRTDPVGCGCSNTQPKVFFLPTLMLFLRVRRASTPAGE